MTRTFRSAPSVPLLVFSFYRLCPALGALGALGVLGVLRLPSILRPASQDEPS